MIRQSSWVDFKRPFRVITPTLDGEVLAVLAAGELRLSGREIARRVGASQDGARIALERLVRQGVVLRDRAGAAHLYSLNRNHLSAKWIEGLASMRLELLRRLRQEIGAWRVPASGAFLFGSVARGDADSSSDLDLLIVRQPGVDSDALKWREQVTLLEAAATSWTGNDARVLEYGAAEFARLRDREPVLRAAMSQGIELKRLQPSSKVSR